MKIAITTDSSSGISSEEAEAFNITVIPIPVIIENQTFYEGIDITVEQIYNALEQGKKVGTSQPTPYMLTSSWEKLLSKGYERIIHIPIARELSSSYDTACVQAQQLQGKVFVVNNHRISIPLREATLKAKELSKKAFTAEEIKNYLESVGNYYRIYLAVDTLEYLCRSGRIHVLTATVGNLLNIKPMLSIEDGSLHFVSRQRGMLKAKKTMLDNLQNEFYLRFANSSVENMTLGIAGTDISDSIVTELKERLSSLFQCKKIYYNELPACVGCHVGRGAIGIGFCFD